MFNYYKIRKFIRFWVRLIRKYFILLEYNYGLISISKMYRVIMKNAES